MNKYYSLRGYLAKNNYYINFYRVLHIIGKYFHCPNKKRIACAMQIIRNHLNKKNIKGISNSEIRNLIKEKKSLLFLGSNIYKISNRTDHIIDSIVSLLLEIELHSHKKPHNFKPIHLKENRYCKNLIISDFNDKLDYIQKYSSKAKKLEINNMIENIKMVKFTC